MSRFGHHLLVSFLALPLLLVFLLVSGRMEFGDRLGMIILWLVTVVLTSEIIWRKVGRPLIDVTHELVVENADDARGAVRDLRENAEMCRDDRDRTVELIEDLSSSLGEGLLVVSDDLRVRLISPVAMRFCGVDTVRPNSHLLEVLREPEIVELVRTAANGESPRPGVLENPRGLWEVRAFPIRGGGAVALVSDVSLIRRASEFRRRFVQDLSHEIRSPLAVLRTTVEAMDDEIDPRLSEIVIRQVERLTRLTDELYELATIESGQLDLNLESVELTSVAGTLLGDFAPEADRRGIDLRLKIPEKLEVMCDRRGLSRVVSNLIDNAIKYNREGGWVELSAESLDEGVHLTVSDSGEGIPAGELQAVTQRFYRLDRARTPGEGGLGLGLAIVKHMVRYMGGSLQLDSREGVGTTISILLPTEPGDGGGPDVIPVDSLSKD
ncbi:MAG: hypothetical protein GY906_20515 [bacterium]|nr:hypothetical protein [bacterium]